MAEIVTLNSRPFAVFDIDGTLIRWQLYHAVVGELSKRDLLGPDSGRRIHDARMRWQRRAHEQAFQNYEQVLLEEYLAALTEIPVEAFNQAVESAVSTYKDQTYTYTRNLLGQLKSEDYVLIAISGSHQQSLAKLADYYGFDHVVGSHYATKDDFHTGEEFTPIHDKGAALRQIVDENDLDYSGSIGVGDTGSDISMLELVERPIAFNPNQELFEHAQQAGWEIVIERKNVVYELETNGQSYVLA